MSHPKLYKVHKWLGIGLFILFFLQGVTGLLMANKGSLSQLEFGTPIPSQAASSTLSLDETINRLQALYPHYTLDRIIYPPSETLPAIARLKSKNHFWLEIVYLDRTSNAPLSHGPLWQYPAQFSERIHVSLLSGKTGHIILLTEGLILSFMAISGLIVWWPKKGRFTRALRITNTLGIKRLVRDLHTVPAVLLSPFLIILGFSGFLIIAEPLVAPVINLFAPVGPGLQLDLKDIERPKTLTSWQTSLEQVAATFPEDRISQIRFVGGDRLFGAVIHSNRFSNPRAHHIAGVDRYSGESLVLEEAGTGLPGDAIMEWFLPIHTGDIYGPFKTLLLSITGFILAALSVTGIIMWQQRRPRRK